MTDAFLKEFFNKERWEKALEIGVAKGIDKGELRLLTSPETRLRLYDAIVSDNYRIAPPHQALIPKDNGDYRTVYVNENIDRIFLSIVNEMLFDKCADMIHKSCKSYQHGIGCGKIVQEVSRHIMKNGGWKSDLSKYFDSVPIEFIDKCFDDIERRVGKSKILDIVRDYYHTDMCFDPDGNLIEHYQSLKQGCAVASFLADAMLYEMDNTLSNLDGYYVRYSDDCLFIGNDYEKAMSIMKSELDKMQMCLNPKKVEYLDKNKWFKFLGFNIKGKDITLSKSRVKTFQKEIFSRCKNASGKRALNSVQRYLYKGDGRYSWATSVLPIINVQKDIDTLNEFVMDCIRVATINKRIKITEVGGLGSVQGKPYTIERGKGSRVKTARERTPKDIDGYMSLRCMQNALLTDRDVYDCLVRQM